MLGLAVSRYFVDQGKCRYNSKDEFLGHGLIHFFYLKRFGMYLVFTFLRSLSFCLCSIWKGFFENISSGSIINT